MTVRHISNSVSVSSIGMETSMYGLFSVYSSSPKLYISNMYSIGSMDIVLRIFCMVKIAGINSVIAFLYISRNLSLTLTFCRIGNIDRYIWRYISSSCSPRRLVLNSYVSYRYIFSGFSGLISADKIEAIASHSSTKNSMIFLTNSSKFPRKSNRSSIFVPLLLMLIVILFCGDRGSGFMVIRNQL